MRLIQTSEGTAAILQILTVTMEEMDEWTPEVLVNAAIDRGYLEISFDRDYLRAIDLAQGLFFST